MTALPPSPDYSAQRDADNLRTLSIFWYIWAAIPALVGCFFFLYIVLGLVIGVAGMAGSSRSEDGAAAAGIGGFFACIGLFFMAILWTIAFLDFKVARSLTRRKSLTLCYVMAALSCLSIPLGLILGIFTFVVLNRPTVKASFA